MERQKTQNSQHYTEEQFWKMESTHLKIYYKATAITTVCHFKRIDKQINGTEIDRHKYSQLVSDKGKKQNSTAKIVFSTNGAVTIRHPHAKN